jgi:hypothetical protein
MTKLKVTADDALQIAEEQGGRNKRASVNHECSFNVVLAPSSVHYKGWVVWYQIVQNERVETLFNLWTDPYTGKIK